MQYIRYFNILTLICGALVLPLGARTLKEIRSSGELRIAVRDKTTVYSRDERGEITGVHYLCGTMFAESLKLRPVFKVVEFADYFRKDARGNLALLSEVDIYADNLTVTASRVEWADFAYVVPAIAICMHMDSTGINKLEDFKKYTISITEGTSYDEILGTIEKKLGVNLLRKIRLKTGYQVSDVVLKRADYTFIDLDQALYMKQKVPALNINYEVLRDVVAMSTNGWAVSKKSPHLRKAVDSFFKEIKQKKVFHKIWENNYGFTYESYLYYINRYKFLSVKDEAVEQLKEKEYDATITTIKDFNSKIEGRPPDESFELWAEATYKKVAAQRDYEKSIAMVKDFQKNEPPPHTMEKLADKLDVVVDKYADELRDEKEEHVEKKNFSRAIEKQRKVTELYPQNFSEKNELKRLEKLKMKHDEEQRKALKDEKARKKAMEMAAAKQKLSERDFKKILDTVDDKEISKAEKEDSGELTAPLMIQGTKVTDDPAAMTKLKKQRDKEISLLKKKSEPEIELLEGQKYFLAGESYFARRDYKPAYRAFESALAMNFRSGECARRMDQITKLQQDIQRREEAEKFRDFEVKFNRAIVLYMKRNYARAFSEILGCLKIFPDNVMARKYFKIISEHMKLEGEKRISSSSMYYQYFGQQTKSIQEHVKRKEYRQASRLCEEVLNLFPHNEDAKELLIKVTFYMQPEARDAILKQYFTSALNNLRAGRKQRALNQFEFIKKVSPAYPEINSYIKQSRQEEEKIEAVTIKSIPLAPSLDRARRLFETKKYKAALKLYREIARYYPENTQALLNASRIENILGTKKEGGGAQANTAARKTAQNYYLKGKFYFRIRDYDKAIFYWKKAFEADRTFRKALIDIRRVQAMQ